MKKGNDEAQEDAGTEQDGAIEEAIKGKRQRQEGNLSVTRQALQRWMRAILFLIVPLILCHVPVIRAAAQTLEVAQVPPQKDPKPKPKGIRIALWDRPSLRIGDDRLRVDVRIKVHGEFFRGFEPPIEADYGLFRFSRKRVALEGHFLKAFEYQLERELGERKRPWRDLFVNFRYVRDLQVQAGRFKLPFSRDELTSSTDLDFVHRSILASALAPGRDVGVMVHGRRRGIGYQLGLFRQDGDNARTDERERATDRERTVAGRLTAAPLRWLRGPLDSLEVAAAFTLGDVPEGFNGLPIESASGGVLFEGLYVKGRRVRLGGELDWTAGPVSLKAEYARLRDERLGQSLTGRDLSPAIYQAWCGSATWVVTGEEKAGGVKARSEFPVSGPGAVELAIRYENFMIRSRDRTGRPQTNPRAGNILGNRNPTWTIGANWYANRFVKLQGNLIRELIEDPARAPIPGTARYWSWIVRLQFAM